jgi:hypothetical protein
MPLPRSSLRFAVAGTFLCALCTLGSLCDQPPVNTWICLNPATGRLDSSIGDWNHYAGGMYDPCHCYDPCGEAPTCPLLVDAGTPGPGCDAGDGGP